MNYSKVLKALRTRMFVSQTETANILGIFYATVNRWENGHHEPAYKAKRKICNLCQRQHVLIED